MEKDIEKQYYFDLIAHCILGCISLFILIFSTINYKSFEQIVNPIVGYCFLIFVILSLIILSSILLIKIIDFIRDFKNVKRQNYEVFVGTVIGFKKNEDTESGIQINCFPVIRNSSGEIVKLKVNIFLTVGEEYTFYYLKYTKIAAVKKEL